MAAGMTSKAWWPWARRLVPLLFLALIVYLLGSRLKAIDWSEVLDALYRLPTASLLGAAGLALTSYLLYGCFDLLGRRFIRSKPARAQTMKVAMISYAFGLSIGSVVGGLALRFRLYSQLGLVLSDIARVAFFSIVTNWLGYLLLAGVVFIWAPVALPPSWRIGQLGMQIFGALLLGIVAVYLVVCAFARRRIWMVRGHEVTIPPFRLALLQLAMASSNWLLMGACVFVLLEQRVAFPMVLLALLASAVAGVVARVPASLGVLETTFFILLSRYIKESDLLAGLVAYRAIYYLAPLLTAALVYFVIEMRFKRRGVKVSQPR